MTVAKAALELGRVIGKKLYSVGSRRYAYGMSEARDLNPDPALEPNELEWLNERISEYRELLDSLRDH